MYQLFLHTRQQAYLATNAANQACIVLYAVIQKNYQICSECVSGKLFESFSLARFLN